MALLIKIILLGDGGVGKTSLRRRFMGQSLETNYVETIGADLAVKGLKLRIDSETTTIQYQIWDLSGQNIFSDIRPIYYRGVAGAIIVFDVTNRSSFENVLNWLEEVRKKTEKKMIPVIILGNKIDSRIKDPNTITTSEGLLLAKKASQVYYRGSPTETLIPYFETSAKTAENVEQAFLKLADMIIQTMKRKKIR